MLPDLRIDKLAAMRPQALERALLVRSHQPRVAGDIGGEDRRKTARFRRRYRLARPSAPVGDAALDEHAPLGHPVSPAIFETFVNASDSIVFNTVSGLAFRPVL